MALAVDRPASTVLMRRRLFRQWPLLPALVFVAVFLIFPVAQLLGLSFLTKEGALTASHYLRLFESPIYLQVLANSFKVASLTMIICLVGGFPVAYLLANLSDSLRGTLLIWVLLPLWTSFLIRSIAWVILLTGKGVINSALMSAGIVDAPVKLLYNFLGLMIGTVQGLMPVAVMMMLSVMMSIDKNLMKAAQTLGARPANQFWRIYVPLAAPGMIAGALVVFVSALGLFVTARLLGGPRDIMLSLLIIQQFEEVYDLNFAAVLSMVLLVSTLIIVFLFDRILGLSALTGENIGARKAQLSPKRLSRRFGLAVVAGIGWFFSALGELRDRIFRTKARTNESPSLFMWAVALVVVFFIAAPTFILLPASTSESNFLSWPPKGFTLDWYAEFFIDPAWRNAFIRSILIGIATAFVAMGLGIPAAYVLGKQAVPGRSAIMTGLLLPVVLPSIIVGVGLFYLYSKIGLLQTSIGLILGHTIFALPYVVITIMAALRAYDERLDHAAWTLGANKLTTFRLISFPLMKAGMASAFLFAFVHSFDELSIALFVTGPNAPTLPKRLWSETLYKLDPSVAAAASIIVLIVAVPIFLSQVLLSRKARGRR